MRQYECLVIQKTYLAKTSKHSLPCFYDSLKFQQEIAHLFVGEVLDHAVFVKKNIYIYIYTPLFSALWLDRRKQNLWCSYS